MEKDGTLSIKSARFHSEGLGVNQPCQIRYIQYFKRFLQGDPIYPVIKYIRKITLEGRPKCNYDGGCKPYLSILHVRTKKEVEINIYEKALQPKKRRFLNLEIHRWSKLLN